MLDDIDSCQHIKQVLNTKARESVLVTYKQALKISLLINETTKFNLIKDNSPFPNEKLALLKLKALECSVCHVNNFNQSSICLQCPNVSCSHHGYSHYKLNQHIFSIDSSNGLIYCYKCDTYINHPDLNEIRTKVHRSMDESKGGEEGEEADQNEDQDAEIDHYSDPNPNSIKGLKGFINFGSTCFISSILQTFIHNPILKARFFNNDEHYFNCTLSSCITCSIDKIFTEFFTSYSNDSYGMTNLLVNSWYKNKSLTGYEEQDAHEFWQYILNEFHKDYKRVEGQHDDDDDYHGKECQCLTHRYFAGELESCIRCNDCNNVNTTIDPTMDLSLELTNLQPKSTIYDCLNSFTKTEALDHYRCQECGNTENPTKSLKINHISSVLSIQLKRFKHSANNFIKNDLAIKNPLYLDMRRYLSETSVNRKDQYLYELFALVVHIGSVNTGHYIVIVKNQFNQWLRFDDSVISLVPEGEIERTNAYLLFYIVHGI